MERFSITKARSRLSWVSTSSFSVALSLQEAHGALQHHQGTLKAILGLHELLLRGPFPTGSPWSASASPRHAQGYLGSPRAPSPWPFPYRKPMERFSITKARSRLSWVSTSSFSVASNADFSLVRIAVAFARSWSLAEIFPASSSISAVRELMLPEDSSMVACNSLI